MTIVHAILLVVLLACLERVPSPPGTSWVAVVLAVLIIAALLLHWV